MAELAIRLSAERCLRLAIIGGGAGAREFMIRFREAGADQFPVSIDVFEPRGVVGRGIAWSDEKTPVLANMRVDTLGPNYTHWALMDELLNEMNHPEAGAEYPTRKAIGAALDERWQRSYKGGPPQWRLAHINKEAIDVEWDGSTATIRTKDDQLYSRYDVVLLALGNLIAKPPRGLEGNPRFINGWDITRIEQIHPDSSVFIIGSGLTAIDATLRVIEFGHKTGNRSIVWHSKSGTLPFIRPKQVSLDAYYLTYPALVDQIEKCKGKACFTLKSIWQRFQLEMLRQSKAVSKFAPDTDYARFLTMYNTLKDAARGREFIDLGIKGSGQVSLWYSAAKLLDEYLIPFLWNAMPDDEKILFMDEWRRDFDRFWAPIPVDNGRRIKQWLEDGTIQLVRTKIQHEAHQATGKLLFDPTLDDPLGEVSKAELQERYKDGFDYIIDASSIPADLTRVDSLLVVNLLRKGMLSEYVLPRADGKRGIPLGARIEWYSGAVLGSNGDPHGWLYTLTGSLTAGAHRFTNSYMAVSVSADRVASELFQQLTS